MAKAEQSPSCHSDIFKDFYPRLETLTSLGEGMLDRLLAEFNILKCNKLGFVGAGILGLPFAFKEAGLVEGCVIMLAVGFISSKAMILLINCKEKILSSPDYYQVWESSLIDHMPQLAL